MKTCLAIYSFASQGRPAFPVRIITLRALASLRKQRSSASHVLFIIARQRGPLGSETSILPCLTASNHEIYPISIMHETCPSVDLRIRDVECHELLRKSALVYLVCSLAISLRSDEWISSTSRLKTCLATDSFGPQGKLLTPVALLLYELELL